MSDWRTPPPSGAFPAPAEGLPPCISMVKMDSRLAILDDSAVCGHELDNRFNVSAGTWTGVRGRDPVFQRLHPEYEGWELAIEFDIYTDDPDEAQAAFERGAEWVRTGEMA